MTAWSRERLKAKKLEEIDFDKIVTDEAMRRYLRYSIPFNKTVQTKRGKVKKKMMLRPRLPKPPNNLQGRGL
jgi:hypothetical protein